MTLLPEVERAILDAVRRDQERRRVPRRLRMRAMRIRLPLFGLAVLLCSTTIALAAGGVLLTGSPVPTPGHPKPTVGFGIPAPGTSRLLALRASDPAGGLPWGMRVIRTTRGYLCMQIGRVDHGRLGELGIDGAFHDDGRFHPLPAKALPDNVGANQSSNIGCDPVQHGTFAGELEGLESSAASNPRAGIGSTSTRRKVSYGLLGPHAVKITYRTATGTSSRRVLAGLGAYLIVQPVGSGSQLGGSGAAMGNAEDPTPPNGALTAISYRYGEKTCTNNGHDNRRMRRACGLSDGAPPKPPVLASVHEPIRIHLRVRHHTVTMAEIVFRAPYPVTSVHQGYFAGAFGCRDTNSGRRTYSGGSLGRDVATGALVHITVGQVLSFACARNVTLAVRYKRELNGIPALTTVGNVTIHIPPGDHAKPLPRRVKERLGRVKHHTARH